MRRKSDKLAQYLIYGSVMGALTLGVCEDLGKKDGPKLEQVREQVERQISGLKNNFVRGCEKLSFNPDAVSGLDQIIGQRDLLYENIGRQANERWLCRAVTRDGLRTGEYVPYFEYAHSD